MKNIIISGANQGIGYYMVEELLNNGYNVTVLDIEINNIKTLMSNIKLYLMETVHQMVHGCF